MAKLFKKKNVHFISKPEIVMVKEPVKIDYSSRMSKFLLPSEKASVIFIRIQGKACPHIVFIDPQERYTHINQLLASHANVNFEDVLEKIFFYEKKLDYYFYGKEGLVLLELAKNVIVSPQWHCMPTDDDLITILFFIKTKNDIVKPSMSLGSRYAIDFDNFKIVTFKVADTKTYRLMHANIVKEFFFFEQDIRIKGMKNETVGTHVTLTKLNKDILTDLRFTVSSLSSLVSVDEFNDLFAFQDYNCSNYLQHIVLCSGGENCGKASDVIEISADKKVVVSVEMGWLNFSYGVVTSSIATTRYANVLLADVIYQFYKTIVDFFDDDREIFLAALLNFMQSYDTPNITDGMRKQAFFDATKKLKGKKQAVMFEKIQACWQIVRCSVLMSVEYNELHKRFETIAFWAKDICTIGVLLLRYCAAQKGSSVEIYRDEFVILSTAPTSMLGGLAELLHAHGIGFYKDKKKIVQRTLDIEVDVSSNTEDWFYVKPDFYEKNLLLTENEWQKILLGSGQLYETEEEMHCFDEKTLKMIESLRAIKKEYGADPKTKKSDGFEIPRLHMFTLLSLNKSGMKLKMTDEDKKIIQGLHNFTVMPALPLPEKLQCHLRDYQSKGYDWLGFLYRHKFGACLADEMGLGKTVQTIAFLAGIHEEKIQKWSTQEYQPHLIVAPASVIGNWEQEIKRFYPAFSTTMYVGSQRKPAFDVDIVLTTYDIVREDVEKLVKVLFHVIIFDEAQAVKNSKSQKASATYQLKALFKACLTGTPLENNAKELCSIVNLALPGLLPEDSTVARLVKQGEYQALSEKIAPFMLRRTKKEYLADLPKKTESNINLEMSKKQKGFYGAIIDEIKREVYKAYRDKTDAQAGIIALTALLRLRQICVAPALLDQGQKYASPKIDYLVEEIEKFQKQKTPLLVFSQFTKALDLLGQRLEEKSICYVRIDGSVPVLKRKKIVEEFQSSDTIFVFILSLKTGGVGLNLTRAQVVYHLDPWWNPAVENQASDRVHRIGQENNVQIFRLIMKDSIEEKMLVLKQKKEALFEAIMKGTSGSKGSMITKQDFDFLLG